jgi:acyl-CoA reductase-like NAD-dependent aldehyde dehydrogenase
MAFIDEAKQGGARVLAGGTRKRNTIAPTVIEDAPESSPLVREEAFGPVAVLAPYASIEHGIAAVNRSRYGLQAGVFTERLDVARAAIRADHLPYGGMKGSGLGREGVHYAMDEYSERKTVIFYRG